MAQLDENNEQIKGQEQTITRLNEEHQTLQERMIMAQQDIKNRETEKDNLTQQLALSQNEKMLAITESEKSKLQLVRADQDVMGMKEQIKELSSKIESLTQAKYEAEKKTAVSEAKCEQFGKQKKL